jgi:hypothetical protein
LLGKYYHFHFPFRQFLIEKAHVDSCGKSVINDAFDFGSGNGAGGKEEK